MPANVIAIPLTAITASTLQIISTMSNTPDLMRIFLNYVISIKTQCAQSIDVDQRESAFSVPGTGIKELRVGNGESKRKVKGKENRNEKAGNMPAFKY